MSALLVPLLAGFARQLGGKSPEHNLSADPAGGAHLLRNAAAVAGAKRLATELDSGFEAQALMTGGAPREPSDWPDHVLDLPPLAELEQCRNYVRLLSAITGGARARGPEVIAVVSAPASIAAGLPAAEEADREELCDVIADVLVGHIATLIESGIHTVALCEHDSGIGYISDASARAAFMAPVRKAGALRGQNVVTFDASDVVSLDANNLSSADRSAESNFLLFASVPPDIDPAQLRAALVAHSDV